MECTDCCREHLLLPSKPLMSYRSLTNLTLSASGPGMGTHSSHGNELCSSVQAQMNAQCCSLPADLTRSPGAVQLSTSHGNSARVCTRATLRQAGGAGWRADPYISTSMASISLVLNLAQSMHALIFLLPSPLRHACAGPPIDHV